MGEERKKNSELHWLDLEERQAAVDAEEHGLLIIFDRPAEPAPPQDEPLARDDDST